MDQTIPWSRYCSGNPLSNEGILLPQYFAGGIKELREIIQFNFLLFYGLNPLQLTQEKPKSSVDQGFTECVNISLLECIQVTEMAFMECAITQPPGGYPSRFSQSNTLFRQIKQFIIGLLKLIIINY